MKADGSRFGSQLLGLNDGAEEVDVVVAEGVGVPMFEEGTRRLASVQV